MSSRTKAEEKVKAELDRVVSELVAGALRWSRTGLAERASLLLQVHGLAVELADEWVQAAARAKGLPVDSPLMGEEWLSGPYSVATSAAALAESVHRLAAGESPVDESQVSMAADGRTRVRVLPASVWDRLLLSGYSAEVWMQEGLAASDVVATAGLAQRDPHHEDGVGVVLGAGNITSIGVLDTLYELLAHNRTVVLKLNPVLDDLQDVLRAVLAPLIEHDAVRVVTGGADVGSYLVHHEDVGHVHITGSIQSHDAIVFGTSDEGARRRAGNKPLLDKPITSELGGVSPTIVVPTRWSARDIDYQAQHVATQRLHNAGHNCIATQVVLVPAAWQRLPEFLHALRHHLDTAPARTPWYPGGKDRVEQAAAAHSRTTRLACNRLLVECDVDEAAEVLTTEYFAPVLAVVRIPGEGSAFLANAAEFANARLSGTLGANVLVHPRVMATMGDAFDDFVASLRYGTIAINAWTAVGYLTARAPWGAYPGHELSNAQSGIGVVHNALLLDRTERTVIRGPFRPMWRSMATGLWHISPRPPWFVTSRTGLDTSRLLVDFVGRPTYGKLPRIFAHALRS